MRAFPSARRFWIKIVLATLVSVGAPEAVWAQETDAAVADPRHSYDLNLNFGTFLSSYTGIAEDVPGWGLRLSIPTSKGVFELGGFSGIGHGAMYRSGAIDYRMDVQFETITAHILLGFHADQYDQTSPVPASSKYAGGWHYGGGVTQQVAGPFYFRFDFRHRFSPGQALEVTLGITYRLPESAVGF